MTKLQYEICEACNNGEIDIDTRDMMLEATRQSKEDTSKAKSLKNDIINNKGASKEEYQRRYLNGKTDTVTYYDNSEKQSRLNDIGASGRTSKMIGDKIGTIIAKHKDEYESLVKTYLDKGFSEKNAKFMAREAIIDKHSKYDTQISRNAMSAKKYESRNKSRGFSPDEKDKHKPTGEGLRKAALKSRFKESNKAIKESEDDIEDLKMEIYERELNGEITAEERELLINYMESRNYYSEGLETYGRKISPEWRELEANAADMWGKRRRKDGDMIQHEVKKNHKSNVDDMEPEKERRHNVRAAFKLSDDEKKERNIVHNVGRLSTATESAVDLKMEIYESELAGEIAVEERVKLIAFLESSIDENIDTLKEKYNETVRRINEHSKKLYDLAMKNGNQSQAHKIKQRRDYELNQADIKYRAALAKYKNE